MVSIDWQLFNVLVVDDDPFQRSIVAKLLGQLGINKVVSADDGHAAAVQLAKNFDLIFLDLNMPGMDGIEFLNVLAAHHSDPGLIFFSGEDVRLLEVAEELARGLSISVLGLVAKPISKENIVQLLEQRGSQLTLRQPQVEQKELTEQEVLDGIEAGAISMFYQPKVDTKTLALVGVEALLRWQTPEGQLIGPGAIIPVAERTGIIHQLTLAIFEASMIQLGGWLREGHNLSMSCNFSIPDLMQPNIVESLDAVLQLAAVPAEKVTLEITESRLPEDISKVMSSLTRLRLKGFEISIDDFGTGFSSMEQLRRFPFTELKIDQAFVTGAADKPAALAILQSSIDLARRLNIRSVAEGIETEEDLSLCRRLGVDLAQGYYLSKPMAPLDVEAWMQTPNANLESDLS
jgi:EAL domain-containing protein (putative c-di-GMP-specific phosphodiesterase class I)/FixJ family two-component response regulator